MCAGGWGVQTSTRGVRGVRTQGVSGGYVPLIPLAPTTIFFKLLIRYFYIFLCTHLEYFNGK